MATLTTDGVNFSDGSTINGTTSNTIGSYFVGVLNAAAYANNTVVTAGTTVAGSNITLAYRYRKICCAGALWETQNFNPGLSGTWRLLGGSVFSTYGQLFVRIA